VRLTKSELVAKLVDANPHLTKRDVEIVVGTIFGQIAAALANDGRVEIRGFGNFFLRPRDARNAINPRTRVTLSIPEKHKPVFRPSKLMIARLNGET
jgi:integration host factor subunit beta